MNNLVLKEVVGDITLEDVFLAYFQCRKNKRSKLECLEFDLDYEENLIKLWEEIKAGTYKVEPLSVFIVERPVKREIFASSFRERIVHHLIVMKLNNIFENEFIYDTYSCRKGRGTHFGVNRVDKFVRSASKNYTEECFVLKLDIKGYFMSINKVILLERLEKIISYKYLESDKNKVIWLCQKTILNDVKVNCFFKSLPDEWDGLPRSKSLFHAKENCGLPIGNYTSQVFSNFYLSGFDHFIKSELKFKYYGRYVDDFVIVSTDRERLKKAIPKIRRFLFESLELELHPKKIYLQNVNHGVEFLGSFIKPWRIYVTRRIKNNFYLSIIVTNQLLKKSKFNYCDALKIRQKMNSYLGILSHYNTHNLKQKNMSLLSPEFYNYFKLPERLQKINFNNSWISTRRSD